MQEVLLATRFRTMLEDGVDPAGIYTDDDRSRMAQAFIAHALNVGVEEGNLEEMLLSRRNELSSWALVHRRKGKLRSESDALRHVRTSIANSVANPASKNYRPAVRSAGEARYEIGEWKGLVASTSWNARRSSLLLVLERFGAIATTTGSLVVTASTRQLAVECGISQKTAARTMERAVEEGWLTRTARPARAAGEPHLLAPAYRLSFPSCVSTASLTDSVATDRTGVRTTESLRYIGATDR